jgi:hypothetical protein
MSALYEIRPYLSAHRIHHTGSPAGAKHVEQHACEHIAAKRLATLNATAPKPKKVQAPQSNAPEQAKEAPGKTAELPLDVVDFSVLDGPLSGLARALGKGTHDDHLDALLEAEENGKTRKGAVAILKSRIGEVA